MAINTRMGVAEWRDLLSLAFLWGVSFFVVEIALVELQPLSIVALRVSIAALVLWVFLLVTGRLTPIGRQGWLSCAVMSVLNNVIPFSLIVWGQQALSGGLASIFNASTPLFTVLVAGFLLQDERLTGARLLGAMTGLTGVAVMMTTSFNNVTVVADAATNGSNNNWLAQLAIVGAAISYAFATVWGRCFKRLGIPATQVVTGQLSVSTIIMIPLALLVDKPLTGTLSLTALSPTTILAILVLAIGCTTLGYLLYFRILSSAGAVNLSLVTLLIPVTAVVLGKLFLNESIGLIEFAGMVIIAIGLLIIDGRLWHRFSYKP